MSYPAPDFKLPPVEKKAKFLHNYLSSNEIKLFEEKKLELSARILFLQFSAVAGTTSLGIDSRVVES